MEILDKNLVNSIAMNYLKINNDLNLGADGGLDEVSNHSSMDIENNVVQNVPILKSLTPSPPKFAGEPKE